MLILTRKFGERIVIDDKIVITVVELGQGRVKIGITAPNDVSIDREEIFLDKIKKNQPKSAS